MHYSFCGSLQQQFCKMGNTCRNVSSFLWSLFLFSNFLSRFSDAADTLTQGQSIKDGETLISAGNDFVLGFFSPANSTNRYVGIWYSKVSTQTIVWVANRENPVQNSTGVLTIGNNGNLMVLDGDGNSVWSTNSSLASNSSLVSNSSVAVLMDSGNLVLTSKEDMGDLDKALWQSFDEPTDTYLPGMKIGLSAQNGKNHIFTSWKTPNDPSIGNYSMGVDPQGSPQVVLWERSTRRWRSGQWNGQTFMGVPSMRPLFLYGFRLFNDGQDGSLYFTYTMFNSSNILRFRVTWDGSEEQLRWNTETEEWTLFWSQPSNECEIYNKCGAFGSCSVSNLPICSCFEGFEPKSSNEWNRGNWSGGCVRRTQLQCERNSSAEVVKEDGFLELEGVKLPDFSDWMAVDDRAECEDECLKNCSCKAYAYVSGIGCMLWGRDLVDVQRFPEGGDTLYVRLADSELGGKSKISKLVIAIIVVLGTIFLSMSIFLLWRFMAKGKGRKQNEEPPSFALPKSREYSTDFSGADDLTGEGQEGNGPELPMFNFNSVAVATDNFSDANKLGQGGFGSVYRGQFPCGQEIAVKRLSRRSGQGLEEFKNEIILIAKLQHRNLVRILGCCVEGEEKMLVYEYMPNNSLDSFIFDPAKQGELNWRTRFNIIEGIARGLLYLHRDSRLRIIHRDLKASNILLDKEMNPKISDFGMARIFGGNQNQANTNRVVGTYGYMAPEYAMEGLFSVKSDVYSFGILLFEIVSGRKTTSFCNSEHSSNILAYVWQLWSEEKTMELVDPSISDSCFRSQALRCIHVGLLCVQDSALERPTMSSVVLMLESETTILPMPRQPTFTIVRDPIERDLNVESHEIVSTNDITITMLQGR